LEELKRDEHEIFDDYIEMIATFGYITLFASVFSVAASIIFVFILVEARSDLFRMENTCRRPIPFKTHTIGSWNSTIELFCCLSVFSNLIISCFCSDQIDYLFPWLGGLRNTSLEALKTVFILEHAIIAAFIALRMVYLYEPSWVTVFMGRRANRADKKK
jgi:hypothetical protein